ncbi:MAG: hypothetical protein ACE5HZ_07350 [Fidelibacterota bacterium]
MMPSPSHGALLPVALSILLTLPAPQPVRSMGVRSRHDVLEKIKTALLDPAGHELRIRWDYTLGGETWSGNGVLQVLGEELLKLTFPGQKILVKGSTIMSWYRETDQVIIDSFDRRDPTNVFSLLLSGFDHFDHVEATGLSDTTAAVVLKGRDLWAFGDITLVVDSRTWMLRSIDVAGGDGLEVSIEITRFAPLSDPQTLKADTLTGSDTVDLRW